jgi:hypothetical protein
MLVLSTVMFASPSPISTRDLWVLPVADERRTPTPLLQTAGKERDGVFSPHGR